MRVSSNYISKFSKKKSMITDVSTSDGKISPSDKTNDFNKQNTSSKQEFFEIRYEMLSSAFAEMNVDMNDYLAEKELLRLLDSRCEFRFDRDIAHGLFSKIPKEEDFQILDQSIIEVQAFVHTFIKAEYLLLLKADEVERRLKRISKQKHSLRQQMLACHPENSSESKILPEGREHNLNLEIIEIISEDFSRKYSPDSRYTAVIRYNGYKYETMEVVNDGLEFNPRFDYTFHLKLHHLRDKVMLSYRNYGTDQRGVMFEESTATLEFNKSMVDKERREIWVDLYDEHQALTQEKMRVALQLKTDNSPKVQYLNEELEQLRKLEKELLAEKKLISSSMKDLLEPFSAKRNNFK